jgi:hypothetical protein
MGALQMTLIVDVASFEWFMREVQPLPLSNRREGNQSPAGDSQPRPYKNRMIDTSRARFQADSCGLRGDQQYYNATISERVSSLTALLALSVQRRGLHVDIAEEAGKNGGCTWPEHSVTYMCMTRRVLVSTWRDDQGRGKADDGTDGAVSPIPS